MLGKFLCWIGWHKWEDNYYLDIPDKCERCGKWDD